MKIRQKIIFYGRVQGVGFRFTCQHSAMGLGITGWVSNKEDGTVWAEFQGEETSISKLIRRLKNDQFIRIDDMEITDIVLDSYEHNFEVI